MSKEKYKEIDYRTDEEKAEILAVKQEYKEWEEFRRLNRDSITSSNVSDLRMDVIMSQLLEDNGCEFKITVILRNDIPDKKKYSRFLLIKHFEELIRNNDNPIFERIAANIRSEKSKQERIKQQEEN